VLRGYGELTDGKYVRTQRKLYAVKPENGSSSLAGSAFTGEWLDYAPMTDGSLAALGIRGTGSEIHRISADGGTTTSSLAHRAAAVGPFGASADGDVVAFVVSDSAHFPALQVAPGIGQIDRAWTATSFNDALDRQPRPVVETIRWPNGEGDTIEGLLYWPPGKRHAIGLPTVVALHGGPQQGVSMALAASSAPFANYPALLAARGYLVLYPVFRGSTGYGDRFTDAFAGARCSRPAADILTGVDHLVKEGWADSTRLGIGGTSFGGTTTSCIIGRTRRFRAAFVSEGSFDGISANLARPPAYSMGRRETTDRPAPWTSFDRFWTESGISTAGAIRTPTLIVHGGKDQVVSFTQSEELAAALDLIGTPYELLRFPSEGHMFSRPGNKRAKVEAEIGWLDHWMLGKPLPE
jgi:dipeptidyl aminopeptidase/acylaminoacyl peptidase